MFKSDGINYDNVRPKANLLSSKKINFHDKKDLTDLLKSINEEKKLNNIKVPIAVKISPDINL